MLTDAQIAEFYTAFLPELVAIGVSRYQLQHLDAEGVANEIFVDFLAKQDRVERPRAFLVGAMHRGCKYHLRKVHRRTERRLPERHDDLVVDDAHQQIIATTLLEDALARLTPRCQRALRLHHLNGCTAREVALELCTSLKYAEKVLRECLLQARRRMAEVTR